MNDGAGTDGMEPSGFGGTERSGGPDGVFAVTPAAAASTKATAAMARIGWATNGRATKRGGSSTLDASQTKGLVVRPIARTTTRRVRELRARR